MRFNPNTHRRQSIRLRGFDYAAPGAYFVTIVTQNRECVFGDVVDGVMVLNELGRMVDDTWHAIPTRFPNVTTDAWVIMPNHVHGIIWIESHGVGAPLVGALIRVGARPTPTLGGVVGAFKSITTVSNIRTVGIFRLGILWQRNFFERIIRNEQELNRIRQYIFDNPKNWEMDEDNPSRVVVPRDR